MRIRALLCVLAGVAMTVGIAAPSVSAAGLASGSATSKCPAVGQNEDASRNGHYCATLPSALRQRWSVTLSGFASYPLIADGKVFEATGGLDGGYGGWLYALDATTGKVARGPIPLSATYYSFSLAYGDGTVFVNDFDGTVTAYAAATGREIWTQTTGYFSGEPVA